jgi:hypothetical protein
VTAPPPAPTSGAEREDQLLIWRELSGRHLVDVKATTVVRARDFYLALGHGQLRLVGVTSRRRGRLRRIRGTHNARHLRIIDRAAIEPFGDRPPDWRVLSRRRSKLSRLRPGQVADLLEQLGASDRRELLEALDPAAAGDALEEMEPAQLERLLRGLPPARAAALLAAMEPDEAADALRGFDRPKQTSCWAICRAGRRSPSVAC